MGATTWSSAREAIVEALSEVKADEIVLRRDRIKLGFLSRVVASQNLYDDVLKSGPRALVGPVFQAPLTLRGGGNLSIAVMIFLAKPKHEDWNGFDVDDFNHNVIDRLRRESDFSGTNTPPPGDATLQSFEYDTEQSNGLVILTYNVSVPVT